MLNVELAEPHSTLNIQQSTFNIVAASWSWRLAILPFARTDARRLEQRHDAVVGAVASRRRVLTVEC
jgi:hypothetical protein